MGQRIMTGRDGKGRAVVLTLLFSPVQWTIAWLCVASPLSTNELLSRDICLSRDAALLKRDELAAEPASNARSSASRRLIDPLSQRTAPGSAVHTARAVSRKMQRFAAEQTAGSGRRGAMAFAP